MSCPACDEPLMILEIDAIEIDHCAACGGTWLDAGELELIAQRAGAKPGRSAALLGGAKAGAKSMRRCVRCQARMLEAEIGAGGGAIRIERCPRGHGLWLDKGELRGLIEAGAGESDAEQKALARFFADVLGGVI
jgi:Zn-finger nucleic acid-binding protein